MTLEQLAEETHLSKSALGSYEGDNFKDISHYAKGHPNCFDNINNVLVEQRPIITPVNLFMYTKINTNGSISVETPISKAGDKIVIKALLDITLGIAACSVSESKCNSGKLFIC